MPSDVSSQKRLSSDSVTKTLIVAISLCLVCSVLVSSATVLLKPIQERNKVLDRKRNILKAAGLLEAGKDLEDLFEQIEPRVVDLATGTYVDTIDPQSYNARKAVKDPAQSMEIPKDQDIAKLNKRANYAVIYLVKEEGQTKTVILPVHGAGLYSTLYGYVALRSDGTTVQGLSFYEQGETPGLGGEIANPRWLSKWPGKRIYDDEGKLRFEVVKGGVDAAQAEAQYQIDAIAGATLTSRGVNNLIRYWFGEGGYRPLLTNIASRG